MGQVHLEVAGHVAIVVLDNPEKRNAVDHQMSDQLSRAYGEIRDRDDVRVAIITGAGDQAFCAGGFIPSYLSGVVGQDGHGQRTPLPKPWRIWKPFIAAIRGACVGGGFGLALTCDLRVAAEDARIGPSGLRRGVIQGGEQTQRLVRLIGLSRALEILLLSRYLSGAEAREAGLVQRVVPSEQVLEAAREWADVIASFSPWAVETTKRLAYEGLHMSWDDALAWEEELTVQSYLTDDAREGFSSFAEGRPPHFGA